MPYDPTTTNSMQASLGLVPGWTPPQPMFMPPAMAAQQMQAQASQQLASGMAMTRLPAASPVGMFGQQFQQQMQGVQSQQSYNPYIAQALTGGFGGGYQSGMMPSPLSMTPPSTGIFRPPPMMPMMPIPPQQVAPMFPGPFTPQLPSPMFQTAWDRELQQRDFRADRIYSTISQGPRVGGMAAGFGAGAAAGAAVGGMFGPIGRLAGAIGGGVLAGVSGFAGGVGDAAMLPMRPSMEVHGMGAALQRSSQQWMLSGPQLHDQGAGLSRVASLQLADQIRGMSAERGFRGSTGGAFNREDLMRITESSGRAGLMDMEQGTDAIRNNLRQVSRVVKRFMELTGDPDVTSVIREMGQMRAFGMSVNDMERAAQNMKTFARAAGVSVQGLQQMGGLPGAMTYQQAGMSAAAGMEMGNYAFAAARQAVATGTYNPRELAMMGGVQGVAQRNVQAQAALTSMPLFGAAIGGYGQGGWGVNYNQLSQVAGGGQGGLGATGMVLGAVQNIGQAVAKGGIGALAEFPLRQRFMQDEAAAAMSPAQQMAMRYQMAMQTGQTLGLEGKAAFTTGARALYGDEVAEQMYMEARNPRAFRAQAAMLRRQNVEIARQQRATMAENAPGFTDILGEKLGISATTRGIFTGGGSIGNALTDMGIALTRDNPVLNYFEDRSARERGERIRRVSPLAAIENEKQRQNILKGIGRGMLDGKTMSQVEDEAKKMRDAGWINTNDTLTLASAELGENIKWQGVGMKASAAVGTAVASVFTGGGVAAAVGVGLAGAAATGALSAAGPENMIARAYRGNMSDSSYAALEKLGKKEAQTRNEMFASGRRTTEKGISGIEAKLGKKYFGGESGRVTMAMNAAAGELDKIARSKVGAIYDSDLRSEDIEKAIMLGFKAQGMSDSDAKSLMSSMSASDKQQLTGNVLNMGRDMGGDYTAKVYKQSEELAAAGMGDLSMDQVKEALATRAAQYEAHTNWGKEGDAGGMVLRGKAREMNTMDYLGLVAMADPSKQEEVYKRYKAGGGKDFGRFMRQAASEFKKISATPGALDALKAQSKYLSVGKIVGWVETKQLQAGVELETSGAERVGKASGVSGLTGMKSAEETAEALIEGGGIEKLAGKDEYRRLSSLLTQYKGANAQAKKGIANKIKQEIASKGTAEAGATTESLTGPEGEQGTQNERSADALEGLANKLEDVGFDDFKEGSADFLEGAKKLREAMDSETMKKIIGEVKG